MRKVSAGEFKNHVDEKDSTPRQRAYHSALNLARQDLRQLAPHDVAGRSGARYSPTKEGQGSFELRFIEQKYTVDYPGGTVHKPDGSLETDVIAQILILHYLIHADGAMPADKWIAFREMPDGQMYDGVFKQRTSIPLARTLGDNLARFKAAARSLHGVPLSFGDASYLFEVLPHLRLAIVLYLADEEFSATANVLFDAAAEHQLPIEDLIVLSETLTHKLRKAPVDE